MSSWLSKAAELNQYGAALIQSGNERLGLEYFKAALEILSLLAMGSTVPGNAAASGSTNAGKLDSMLSENPQLLASAPVALSSSVASASDDFSPSLSNNTGEEEIHYVFERALTFAVAEEEHLTPELLSFDIAVVEFNMALSLQLLSRRFGEKPLYNALQIYDCCLDHLHRSGCRADACNTLLFATLNNKAVIFYSVSNFQTARDVLWSLLDGVNSCRSKGEGLSFIEDQDLEGFLFNVMLLRGACIAPAA
jgi:hypothetical protein